MIVETFGPLAEARRRPAKHWLTVFAILNFSSTPRQVSPSILRAARRPRTLGVSFILTMPTLN